MYQKQLLLVCVLSHLPLPYACTLWGNNYNAPLSQIVKLQNKAVRVFNEVPLMESITPHFTPLGLLKLPDIVGLNTCMLFYDYFHHDKFSNIPVSLSELHIYSTRSASSNQVATPSFRTNLRRFCPALLEVSFGMIFHNSSGTNHREKCSEKHFYAVTLLNTIDTLALL